MFTRRERLILCAWLLSWLIIPVAAQVRPGLFSTLVTTDTTANSLVVGGTAGGTTGTGGIKSGAVTVATSGTNLSTFNSTAANGGFLTMQRSGTSTLNLGNALPVIGVGTTSDALLYTDNVLWLSADGGMNFADVGVKRWGINAAGDLTVGASSHIFASNGTPVITSGAGTSPSIAGIDSAFQITEGTPTGGTLITVTFGHTFNSAPSCAVVNAIASAPNNASSSTTQVFLAFTVAPVAGTFVQVHCFGY